MYTTLRYQSQISAAFWLWRSDAAEGQEGSLNYIHGGGLWRVIIYTGTGRVTILEFSRIVPPIQYMRLIEHEVSLWLRMVRSASEMRTRKRGAFQMISSLKV